MPVSKRKAAKKSKPKPAIKRPMILKIIIAYYLLATLFILVVATGSFKYVLSSIVSAIVLYYGLWKMKRLWMHLFVLRVVLGIVYFWPQTGFSVFYIFDIAAVCWLLLNRKLFSYHKLQSLGIRAIVSNFWENTKDP